MQPPKEIVEHAAERAEAVEWVRENLEETRGDPDPEPHEIWDRTEGLWDQLGRAGWAAFAALRFADARRLFAERVDLAPARDALGPHPDFGVEPEPSSREILERDGWLAGRLDLYRNHVERLAAIEPVADMALYEKISFGTALLGEPELRASWDAEIDRLEALQREEDAMEEGKGFFEAVSVDLPLAEAAWWRNDLDACRAHAEAVLAVPPLPRHLQRESTLGLPESARRRCLAFRHLLDSGQRDLAEARDLLLEELAAVARHPVQAPRVVLVLLAAVCPADPRDATVVEFRESYPEVAGRLLPEP